jgi:hypothetical protein
MSVEDAQPEMARQFLERHWSRASFHATTHAPPGFHQAVLRL